MTRPFEFYETPPGVTAALLAHLPSLERRSVLDPCVGDGAIVRVLEERYPHALYMTNDLDPLRPADRHVDATTAEGWRELERRAGLSLIDWVITNPPFSLAHLIIPQAIERARRGVAMLLPLRFIEPTRERALVLESYPWSAQVTLGSPRPSFTEDGRTDSLTTFWAIWEKGRERLPLYYATSPFDRWQNARSMSYT